MPRVTIDNREIEVPAGATILEAAEQAAVRIPTLCFLKGRRSLTSCFVCIVKVHGKHHYVPACATEASEGLRVESETEEVRHARRAALELGVRSPLLEAGLNKEDIRQLSRGLGLPTWDKPAFACLASRLPYGTPITPQAVARIDRAEAYIRSLGLAQVRVRCHGEVARIEVEAKDMAILFEKRQEVAESLRSLGFTYVALDLLGYRPGSMNEALK